MTSTNNTLDSIRRGIGELGDDVPSEEVESMQGQDEKVEANIEEKSDEYRADVEEEVRKPKPAARPYTSTRARSMSTK